MDFLCEDLPQYGVHLIPPSSLDYARLLAEIQRRASQPLDGEPPFLERERVRISDQEPATSAILLNRSGMTIAAMRTLWVYQTVTGHSYRHMRDMLSPENVLLPFGRREEALQLNRYWTTILSGSKRYLCNAGMVGDNGDVRPPNPGETWAGTSFWNGGARGGLPDKDPVRAVTLVLDGVFFIDGGFAGKNEGKLFEATVADVEAHRLVGRIARDGHNRDLPSAQIFANIEKATAPWRAMVGGPVSSNPDATMEDFRNVALGRLGLQFSHSPTSPKFAEARVLSTMTWDETVVPNFRRI